MSRLLEIITPLGEGNVMLRGLNGHETLGSLPEFKLLLVARRGDIKPSEFLGKNITIGMEMPSGIQPATRYLNGFITDFSDAGETSKLYFQDQGKSKAYLYEATLNTSFWLLTRTSDCRIFQNKTVPQIIQEVVKQYPFANLDIRKLQNRAYSQWEYCCQYRETDFNFISRLMEQEGIYYYFEHENGKHTMVLCDGQGSHPVKSGYEKIHYLDASDAGKVAYEFLTDLHITHTIQPGRVTLGDYNFTTPATDIFKSEELAGEHDFNKFEVFDYPGEYDTADDGKHYAKVRIQELRAEHEVITTRGSVHGLQAGYKFDLIEHPRKAMNKKYLILSATYHITNNLQSSGGSPAEFSCNIRIMPADKTFSPPRRSFKPMIAGPQTAVVVGPAGEEIFTDKYGRVKVQFHWDRYSKSNDQSSCFVRVAQAWAGKQWGSMHIPRIGHEVVVEFMEGDPDWPIITGGVYNEANMPPWALEANKTRSGIKSRSYKGGSDNFNEFRFEDKKGEEHIYQHAERDHILRTKHDRQEWIGNESHLIVKKDVFVQHDADHHYKLKGDDNREVGGTTSLKTNQDWQVKVGSKTGIDSGMEVHIKAGVKAVIEAGAQLSLKVGGSFITIDPSGVSIKGPMVNINSGGSAASGSGTSPHPPKPPKEAASSQGGQKSVVKKPTKPLEYSPQAQTLKLAAKNATPFCKKCEEAKQNAQSTEPTKSSTPKGSGKGGSTQVTVDEKNKTIQIQTKMEFSGPDATEAYAQAAKKQIEETWSGTTTYKGSTYKVSTTIDTKVNTTSTPTKGYDQIIVDKNTTRMSQTMFGAGPGWQTPAAATDQQRPRRIAHEYGHTLGLDDEYKTDATGYSAKDPNKKNNIMAETWPDATGKLPHPHDDHYQAILKNHGHK